MRASTGIRFHLLLNTLIGLPWFVGVFAIIEMGIVGYVWSELWYPPVYCGAVRPLSMYYYPILMTLFDTIKLNIYACSKCIQSKQYLSGVQMLFNIKLFIAFTWTTVLLSVMCVVNGCTAMYSYCLCMISDVNTQEQQARSCSLGSKELICSHIPHPSHTKNPML